MPAGEGGRLLATGDEGRLFWTLRRRLIANVVAQLFRDDRLRAVVVLTVSVFFWGGLFWLSLQGFNFLSMAIRHRETLDQTVRLVFGVFFASLLMMLFFSVGIILYSTLYRTSEARFLLTTPARAERVFLYKLQEALVLSSWGFVLMGSPMLVAYGVVVEAPWYYFALLPAFIVGFVHIPCSLGGVACLTIVRWLPRIGVRHLVALGVVAAGGLGWFAWSSFHSPAADAFTPDWFREMLGRLQFSQHYLLPSWWLCAGLLETAAGVWPEGTMFLAVTIANALLGHQFAVWTAGRLYRRGFSEVINRRPGGRRRPAGWIDQAVMRLAFFMSKKLRLLFVKDFRLFRRDPLQWSQFSIFFGLVGIYFINLRRFNYDLSQAVWVNVISFLNVAVIGLLLATFTTRFIFPMLSLEGRRLWILGRLPIRRDLILWSKFLFATAGSCATCTLVVVASDVVLRVPGWVVAVHCLTAVVLCVGLSGIAVGLGAAMPNLREESPSKIAAGFGGTLNLVVSSLYIIVVVLLTAVPCHLHLSAPQVGPQEGFWAASQLQRWLAMGSAASVLLGVVATVLPMWLGLRSFRNLELP